MLKGLTLTDPRYLDTIPEQIILELELDRVLVRGGDRDDWFAEQERENPVDLDKAIEFDRLEEEASEEEKMVAIARLRQMVGSLDEEMVEIPDLGPRDAEPRTGEEGESLPGYDDSDGFDDVIEDEDDR